MENLQKTHIVAFQGMAGAYSDLVARTLFPSATTLPCMQFDEAFNVVKTGKADVAVIPVDNSVAGRVADVYHLLPQAGLHIIAEHFQRIEHCLLGIGGARLEDVKHVYSHVQGLSQCRRFLQRKGFTPVVHADTAGAAHFVAQQGNPSYAAIASSLAAQTYGLAILARNIEDAAHNTTRFLVLAAAPLLPPVGKGKVMTSLVFTSRSVPASLYKALGGFATNGLNLTKIESYMLDGHFQAVQFFIDVEGHPEDAAMQHALEELKFFTKNYSVLGCYAAHPYRYTAFV